jgi:hypothetical protein
MLKTTVDSEVIEQTMQFIQQVFLRHGTQIAIPVDYFLLTYLEMCHKIKKHSQEQIWIAQNTPNAVQLADISFSQAAEIATKKNSSIDEYLGKNFRSNASVLSVCIRLQVNLQYDDIYALIHLVLQSWPFLILSLIAEALQNKRPLYH